MRTLEWKNGRLCLLDQTLLPHEKKVIECATYQDVADAIMAMKVRGAPAIGVTAAYGMVLACIEACGKGLDTEGLCAYLNGAADTLRKTRPTAVNLFWAIDRMVRIAESSRSASAEEICRRLTQEADDMAEEDIRINRQIGAHGQALFSEKETVLTHCNTGALATVGFGTALGMIRAAHEAGKRISVYADETRPYLQGARLTAWELKEAGIPVTLITDSMAGFFIKKGVITAAVVGADRIAANGDVANKIGTYSIAVLAKENQVPFYVAAPISTLDLTLSSGELIPIEERNPREITHIGSHAIAPDGIAVANPAFDVTPARYVTAIITEKGVVYPPFEENLKNLVD